jgi:hypothetical protein
MTLLRAATDSETWPFHEAIATSSWAFVVDLPGFFASLITGITGSGTVVCGWASLGTAMP